MFISSLKLYMVTPWAWEFCLSNKHTCRDRGEHTPTDNTYWAEYVAHLNKPPQRRFIFQCHLLQLGLWFILFVIYFILFICFHIKAQHNRGPSLLRLSQNQSITYGETEIPGSYAAWPDRGCCPTGLNSPEQTEVKLNLSHIRTSHMPGSTVCWILFQ